MRGEQISPPAQAQVVNVLCLRGPGRTAPGLPASLFRVQPAAGALGPLTVHESFLKNCSLPGTVLGPENTVVLSEDLLMDRVIQFKFKNT